MEYTLANNIKKGNKTYLSPFFKLIIKEITYKYFYYINHILE